jgi:uncharacterized protein YutE (UPF0331/DUF86 family)
MNIESKRKLTYQQLKEHLMGLEKALETLRYSYVKCNKITGKDKLNAEDQESFEALTSRFARTADMLTQKVLKTLFALLHERPRTFLDSANLLEKLEIIEDADNIINIRELRNQIAHEYVIDDLHELFADVLRFVPELERVFGNVKIYIERNLGDKSP